MKRALLALLLVSCGSDEAKVVPYDGVWELVSVEKGACDGPLASDAIPEKVRYFRLADTTLPTGRLMAFYPCEGPSSCSDVFDFYYSFGLVDGAWSTSIYTAVKPPCQLSATRRTLSRFEVDTLSVETLGFRQVDDSIAPDACTYPLAKARASGLPCVARELWTARRVR